MDVYTQTLLICLAIFFMNAERRSYSPRSIFGCIVLCSIVIFFQFIFQMIYYSIYQKFYIF